MPRPWLAVGTSATRAPRTVAPHHVHAAEFPEGECVGSAPVESLRIDAMQLEH
jgi:hypothetical protein